jgi:hypothetical protein
MGQMFMVLSLLETEYFFYFHRGPIVHNYSSGAVICASFVDWSSGPLLPFMSLTLPEIFNLHNRRSYTASKEFTCILMYCVPA